MKLGKGDAGKHGAALGSHHELPSAGKVTQVATGPHLFDRGPSLFQSAAQVLGFDAFVVPNEGAPIDEIEVETVH
ncbi:hypothetical protein OPKNFCMD_4909 [Methylobacterium crusticola]|uniref:Uncharacterized protein n=1 Tax=Methylobacterium crusticola TaxID=1697972 RepID=A0ABQ4R5W6_9HYPH|nr:hypothetical protein OPKNFCMD_4909 [Methylobacterium crusticola]